MVGIYHPTSHEDELAALKPVYFMCSPAHPGAGHAICGFERNGERHAELFMLNKDDDIQQQLELIELVAGGRMFQNMRLLLWYGPQTTGMKRLGE